VRKFISVPRRRMRGLSCGVACMGPDDVWEYYIAKYDSVFRKLNCFLLKRGGLNFSLLGGT
jgi:hypothetical protein